MRETSVTSLCRAGRRSAALLAIACCLFVVSPTGAEPPSSLSGKTTRSYVANLGDLDKTLTIPQEASESERSLHVRIISRNGIATLISNQQVRLLERRRAIVCAFQDSFCVIPINDASDVEFAEHTLDGYPGSPDTIGEIKSNPDETSLAVCWMNPARSAVGFPVGVWDIEKSEWIGNIGVTRRGSPVWSDAHQTWITSYENEILAIEAPGRETVIARLEHDDVWLLAAHEGRVYYVHENGLYQTGRDEAIFELEGEQDHFSFAALSTGLLLAKGAEVILLSHNGERLTSTPTEVPLRFSRTNPPANRVGASDGSNLGFIVTVTDEPAIEIQQVWPTEARPARH